MGRTSSKKEVIYSKEDLKSIEKAQKSDSHDPGLHLKAGMT